MAPKKSQGKSIAPQELPGVQPEEEFGPVLVGNKYSSDVERFRLMVAAKHNEHGATTLTSA